MVTELEIRAAYVFLRENNNSIPSETLEFMLIASLEKLRNCWCDSAMSDMLVLPEKWCVERTEESHVAIDKWIRQNTDSHETIGDFLHFPPHEGCYLLLSKMSQYTILTYTQFERLVLKKNPKFASAGGSDGGGAVIEKSLK